MVSLLFYIYIYTTAKSSKKETKKERYGEAVGKLTHEVSETIIGSAFLLTEPADKKKLRLAREELASRHASLYGFKHYWNKEYFEHLLTVDDRLKSALDDLGLSEERWKKLALRIYNIGIIRKFSQDSDRKFHESSKRSREDMLRNWNVGGLKDSLDALIASLSFFNISTEEWVEYGDFVLEMHDICLNHDLVEFGYI